MYIHQANGRTQSTFSITLLNIFVRSETRSLSYLGAFEWMRFGVSRPERTSASEYGRSKFN